MAAVSCGIVGGEAVLDLDYAEDSGAKADANFVLSASGGIVEVQVTAEETPDRRRAVRGHARAGRSSGIADLVALQRQALAMLIDGPAAAWSPPTIRASCASSSTCWSRTGSRWWGPPRSGLPEPEETGDSFAANAAAQGAGRRRRHRPAGAGRRQRHRRPRPRRRARHPLGALGRARARLRSRDRARCWTACVARFGSFAAADRRGRVRRRRCASPCPAASDRLFEGRVDGTLVDTPRGARGFGYDPIFVPDGHERTFAEMTAAEKHAISHRRRALDAFLAALAAT